MSRGLRYGSLTAGQFDDLERLSILGMATTADFGSKRRSSASVVRAMGRYQREGWVERDGEVVSAWRLTMGGVRVFDLALAHMDELANNLEGDEHE